MLILMDISGSMVDDLSGELAAVQTFLQELESADLSVGVMYFPRYVSSTVQCTTSAYASPDVPIALLPGNASAIVNDFAGLTAYGTSVTTPVLEGAIGIVRAWQSAHALSPGAVVMINDGGMTIGCPTETVAGAVAVAQAGFNGSPSVSTHVIAVGTGSTSQDQQWWPQVPSAGGGTLTQTGSVGQTAILDALRNIRETIMCQ